mmetsp:Transcript_25312/g.40780  ORF Transcript_25312/g.40780 Transcript_25312/m.40780 type:complete len:88 (+) Transcript_25312:3-266(+)
MRMCVYVYVCVFVYACISSCARCTTKPFNHAENISFEVCSPYTEGECPLRVNPEQNKCDSVHMCAGGSYERPMKRAGKKADVARWCI